MAAGRGPCLTSPPSSTHCDLTESFKKDLSFADRVHRHGVWSPGHCQSLLTPDNAKECVARGAATIEASNHGGRQLDTVPAAITALPGIVEAVLITSTTHVQFSEESALKRNDSRQPDTPC